MSHAKAEQEFVTPRTQRIDSGLRGVQVVQAAPLEAAVEASLALSLPPSGQIWRSYYYSGSLRIAVRETTSASSTLHFLLSDHLGSTVSSVDSGGQAVTQRYWAWGETRSGGGLPTSFQYTGQYKTEALGIYFYGARWYDASLNRWLQPDSVIPDPGNPLDWDRYAYCRNNPVNLVDPTGHESKKYLFTDADFVGQWLYGIDFTGEGWTLENMGYVVEAARQVGEQFSETLGGSPSQAFRQVYGTSTTTPFTFQWGNCTECNGAGGFTYGAKKIAFETMAASWREDYQTRRIFNVIHELGHAFKWKCSNATGVDVYNVLNVRQENDSGFPNRVSGVEGYFGFASIKGPWQQSTDSTPNEEFADMFIGWTHNTWEGGSMFWSTAGSRRARFMNGYMPSWIFSIIGR